MTGEQPADLNAPDPAAPRSRDLTRAGRAAAFAANAMVATISGVTAIMATGAGKVIFGVVFAVAVLFAAGQIVIKRIRAGERSRTAAIRRHYEAKLESMRTTQLSDGRGRREPRPTQRTRDLEAELMRVRTVLREMSLASPDSYRSEIRLEYFVGVNGNKDIVVERRRTTPVLPSGLPFFDGRLTVPVNPDSSSVKTSDLELVARSDDDHTSIRTVVIQEQLGLLRCLFIFVPRLDRPTSWWIRYRVPHLWDQLRLEGHDFLTWTPSARVGDPTRSVVSSLSVTFIFPQSVPAHQVTVTDQDGVQLPSSTRGDGSVFATWSIKDPLPQTYRWTLELRQMASRRGGSAASD